VQEVEAGQPSERAGQTIKFQGLLADLDVQLLQERCFAGTRPVSEGR